jgi:hypothetical protein
MKMGLFGKKSDINKIFDKVDEANFNIRDLRRDERDTGNGIRRPKK